MDKSTVGKKSVFKQPFWITDDNNHMANSALKIARPLPPEIRVVPEPLKPWQLTQIPAANTNVEIIEGFAQKFLRMGGKILRHAFFYAQFLEFEGDTPIREPRYAPIIDKPPEGYTVPQWLAEMEEGARIAAEVYSIQQQIRQWEYYGIPHVANALRRQLEQLMAQVETVAQGSLVLGNVLKIVASAGKPEWGSDAATAAGAGESDSKGQNPLSRLGSYVMAKLGRTQTPPAASGLSPVVIAGRDLLKTLVVAGDNSYGLTINDVTQSWVIEIGSDGKQVDNRLILSEKGVATLHAIVEYHAERNELVIRDTGNGSIVHTEKIPYVTIREGERVIDVQYVQFMSIRIGDATLSLFFERKFDRATVEKIRAMPIQLLEPLYVIAPLPTAIRSGFWFVRLQQEEMYDLGNIAWIEHFLLVDADTHTAIDVTSDISPAPLLSETAPCDVLKPENVDFLLDVLVNGNIPEGWKNPQKVDNVHGMEEYPRGPIMMAREVSGSEFVAMRTAMLAVRQAREALNASVEAMRRLARASKDNLLP